MKTAHILALLLIPIVLSTPFAGCGPKREATGDKAISRATDLVFTGTILQAYAHRGENILPTAKAVIIEIEKVKKGRPRNKFSRNKVVFVVDRPADLFIGFEGVPVGKRFTFHVIQKEIPRPMIILAEPLEDDNGN